MFWLTTNHALFVSTFIWLGRIFDTKSAHNVGLLLKAVEQNLPELDREALRKRKEEFITPAQAADYVKEKHDTAIDDVRELRKQVREWRKIYEPVYGEVRDHLAHNKGAKGELDALLARTNIDEMKRLFAFLTRAPRSPDRTLPQWPQPAAAAGCDVQSAAGQSTPSRRQGLCRGAGVAALDGRRVTKPFSLSP